MSLPDSIVASGSQAAHDAAWDPFDAPEDPFPVYKALRDRAPAYCNTKRDF